jgi:hypothetical protein
MSWNVGFLLVAIGVFAAFVATRTVVSVTRRRAMLRRLAMQRIGRTEQTLVAELEEDGVDVSSRGRSLARSSAPYASTMDSNPSRSPRTTISEWSMSSF